QAIALSHYGVIANVIQMAALQRDNGKPRGPDQWVLLAGETVTGMLPFFHVYGLIVNAMLQLIVDIIPKFSLSNLLESITKYHISHLFLVPPVVVLMCKSAPAAKRDYSHVKLIFTGGASLSVTLMEDAMKLFPNTSITQGYGKRQLVPTVQMFDLMSGMSEIIIATIQSPLERINDGSCGPMLPGFVGKVLKADGSFGGPGETGELIMTSPSLGLGYLGDEEATQTTFVDGWIHSGDEVKFSEDGRLFILISRMRFQKELIKVRGFQVAPAEIEDHLMSHQYVADACVVAFPDEYSGEVPLAFVVPSALAAGMIDRAADKDATEAEIKQEIQKHVSNHKIKEKWLAGGVRFIQVVPKSPSGKILRRILRDGLVSK
ncbi:hypothetical protein FB45DRAFT_741431, partial [Roridomyces roridus]